MENKKSEMSVEYNMDEMKKSLKNLKETECYDVEKYTYSLLHQTRQLEYFYCQLVEEENPEPDQTYYHVSRRPILGVIAQPAAQNNTDFSLTADSEHLFRRVVDSLHFVHRFSP